MVASALKNAAGIKCIVNAPVQFTLPINCRDMVKGQRRRDDVAGRQGIVIGAFLEADLVSITRKTVARPLKHLQINVDQFGFAEQPLRGCGSGMSRASLL